MSAAPAAAAAPTPNPKPPLPKVLIAVGLTLAFIGASIEPIHPDVAYYLLLASSALGHFTAYLGWSS